MRRRTMERGTLDARYPRGAISGCRGVHIRRWYLANHRAAWGSAYIVVVWRWKVKRGNWKQAKKLYNMTVNGAVHR